LLEATHHDALIAQLTQLNKVGKELAQISGVTAMTDVTGFGLAGHLIEMAEGSGNSAELYYGQLPVMDGVRQYLAQRIVPDATYRNWNGYGDKISFAPDVNVMEAFSLLPDPQTNGGLLIAVSPNSVNEVTALLKEHGLFATSIGQIIPRSEKIINVE